MADGAATRAVRSEEPDAEVAKLLVGHRRRSAGQRIGSARHLGNAMTCRMLRLAGHECQEALDAHRETPCGGAPIASASRRNANFPCASSSLIPMVGRRPAGYPLGGSGSSPSRGSHLVPDEVVVLAECVAWIGCHAILVPGDGRGERMVQERPVARVLVARRAGSRSPSGRDPCPTGSSCVRDEMRSPPSTRATVVSSPAANSTVEPGSARTNRARGPRGLRDRRAHRRRRRVHEPFRPHSFAISSSRSRPAEQRRGATR